MVEKTRNYKSEYANYHAKPEQRERNNARKRARYDLEKKGVVSKGDGKDVDHVNGKPKDNRPKNLRVVTKTANRSFPRTKTAAKKNPKD
jgi:hypothetical protein